MRSVKSSDDSSTYSSCMILPLCKVPCKSVKTCTASWGGGPNWRSASWMFMRRFLRLLVFDQVPYIRCHRHTSTGMHLHRHIRRNKCQDTAEDRHRHLCTFPYRYTPSATHDNQHPPRIARVWAACRARQQMSIRLHALYNRRKSHDMGHMLCACIGD